jgi:hypothetical protein
MHNYGDRECTVIYSMYQMASTKAHRCGEEWSSCEFVFYEGALDDILFSIHCGEKAASEASTGVGLLFEEIKEKDY